VKRGGGGERPYLGLLDLFRGKKNLWGRELTRDVGEVNRRSIFCGRGYLICGIQKGGECRARSLTEGRGGGTKKPGSLYSGYARLERDEFVRNFSRSPDFSKKRRIPIQTGSSLARPGGRGKRDHLRKSAWM